MDRETTRRAALAALLGGGVAGGVLSPASSFLDRFAPLSGSTWKAARATRKSRVDSPYGPAELRYDDVGVPHISADDEQALYFAVGYAQGTDRLFQMDLQRRLFSGRLSEIVGDAAVESDTFHRQMKFQEAAEATVEHLRDSSEHGLSVEATADDLEAAGDAYAEGVNAAMAEETLQLEFQLLEYEPEPWQLVDSLLVEKIIGWGLTGRFQTLRRALVRENFEEDLTEDLFPFRHDHDSQIIQQDIHDVDGFGLGMPEGEASGETVDRELVDWLSQFEQSGFLGSNSWVVGEEHTAGDGPILCNDPHLTLQAPPIWYEMHLDGPRHRTRGVTFPGVPFVVIGENDHGAWGFTNAYSDVIDFYRYDQDGDTYEYGDEQREFEVETQEIEVDGGENEQIEVRESVHGPVIEEAQQEVGVAWTGHGATETVLAAYGLTHSEGMDQALEAAEKFEVPTQNFSYADRDGNILYHMVGRLPIRRTDGQPVPGNQIFDGSAREGEWRGFEPFGRPTAWDEDQPADPAEWDVVPFEENPHVHNPEYFATANQQIVDDDLLGYYLAHLYSSPYRGKRIYDRIETRIDSEDPVDLAFMQDLGRDSYDGRAETLVDPLVEAARDGDGEFGDAPDMLADWDSHMDADSEAALLFSVWFDEYREAILGDPFDAAELDDTYYPVDAAFVQLPEDSGWFGPNGRPATMREALQAALDTIDEEGHETYGDISHTGVINHPLGEQVGLLDFLNYPTFPRGGSPQTVWNFAFRESFGTSFMMQADLDGDLLGLLPGGNSGRYFSEHYDDQLERWANGEYRTLSRDIEGNLTTTFEEGER